MMRGQTNIKNVLVWLGILIFAASTSLFVLVTTKPVTICNNWEWCDESISGQGSWRDEIKVFLLKTNDEKM